MLLTNNNKSLCAISPIDFYLPMSICFVQKYTCKSKDTLILSLTSQGFSESFCRRDQNAFVGCWKESSSLDTNIFTPGLLVGVSWFGLQNSSHKRSEFQTGVVIPYHCGKTTCHGPLWEPTQLQIELLWKEEQSWWMRRHWSLTEQHRRVSVASSSFSRWPHKCLGFVYFGSRSPDHCPKLAAALFVNTVRSWPSCALSWLWSWLCILAWTRVSHAIWIVGSSCSWDLSLYLVSFVSEFHVPFKQQSFPGWWFVWHHSKLLQKQTTFENIPNIKRWIRPQILGRLANKCLRTIFTRYNWYLGSQTNGQS